MATNKITKIAAGQVEINQHGTITEVTYDQAFVEVQYNGAILLVTLNGRPFSFLLTGNTFIVNAFGTDVDMTANTAAQIESYLINNVFIKPNAGTGSSGSAAYTAAAILRSFNIARRNNPHYNDDMTTTSTAPTITAGGASPAITTPNIYNAVNNSLPDTTVLTYFGGTPLVYSSTFLRFGAATLKAAGNAVGNLNGCAGRIAFVTDAPKISIGMLGGVYTYRVISDGQYVSKTPITLSSGGRQYIDLDFTSVGGSKERVIQVEFHLAGAITTVAVGPTYKIWKLPVEAVAAIFQGDSFTSSVGTTLTEADGYAMVAADYLGIKNVTLAGVGSTGYTTPVNLSENRFIDRVQADVIAKNPQLVVLAGGINDVNDATLQPAVLLLLQTIRTGLPRAIIMVLGCWAGNSGPDAGTQAKEAAIAAAVAQMGDRYCAYIPVSPDGNTKNGKSWVNGTGTTSAPTGDGNSDVVTGPGAPHPGDQGHKFLGYRVALAIANALLPMA